jgi:hypothetical protein
MLLERFAGTPKDELLDRLASSPALAGPELTFLRARIAERRGDLTQAAALVTECLNELPGHQGYVDFAVEVGAELPPRPRAAIRARPDLGHVSQCGPSRGARHAEYPGRPAS